MKIISFLLATGGFLCLTATSIYSAETAQTRMYCLSPKFQRATAYDNSFFRWNVDLTTLSFGINGELAPYFLTSSYTHSAYVQIYYELDDQTDDGRLALDVPNGGDANGDGFPDFFDVSQPVNNLVTSGYLQTSYYFPNGVNFQATWNRAAGSAAGTCSYQLYNPYTLENLQFTHTFTLLEYSGPLAYTPGSNSVSGDANLTQTGNPDNTLQGPIIFDKSTTDRFNTLTNKPGVWTNAAMQSLGFTSHVISRDLILLTNYYGYVQFNDFDPNTTDPDYTTWVISIDDSNDANANGIPDFSDDPLTVLPPRQPSLALAFGTTNLLLTISGDVNHLHEIQANTNLLTTNWLPVLSFNLTNDPQTVSVPMPAGNLNFWRVRAE